MLDVPESFEGQHIILNPGRLASRSCAVREQGFACRSSLSPASRRKLLIPKMEATAAFLG